VKPEDQPILIIFHNCMAAERKYLNSQVMNDILKNNRHYKYCTLTVVQYFNDLAEDTRGNFDVLVVLKVPSLKMVDKSLEYIFNLGDDDDISNKDSGEKEKLAKMLDKYTENYGCLIKDNTTSFSSGKSQFDHFFYYKPSPVPRSFFKEAKFNSCPILKSLETAFLEHTNKAPPKVEKKMDWSSFSCPLIPLSKSNKLLVNVSASSDTNHYRIFSFVPGLVRKDLTIVVNYHQCDSSSSISVDICPTDFAIVDEGKKKKTKRSLFKVLVKYDEHGRPIDDDDYEHVDKEEKQEEKYEEKKCEEKIITKEINYEKFYFSKKTISLKNSIPHPEKLPSAKVENGTLEIIIPYLPYVAPVLKTFVIP
jgi:HSP20 family molecular chaperone IbpA